MQSTVDRPGVGFPHPHPTLSFWLQGTRNNALIGHRTTDTIPSDADVVIIGAGMSGAATAYHILKGHDSTRGSLPNVLILEAREACYGATGRNGGHCKPDFYRGGFCVVGSLPHLWVEPIGKVTQNTRRRLARTKPRRFLRTSKCVISYCC